MQLKGFTLLPVFLFYILNPVIAGEKIASKKVISLIDSSKSNLSDSIKAYSFANKAIEEAQSDISIAKAMYNKAQILKHYRKYGEAIRYYDSAIKAYEKAGSKNEIPKLLTITGRIYYNFGDYKTAMTLYLKGLSICENLNMKGDTKGWLLRYIGSVFKRQRNHDKALEYYQKAYKVFKNNNDTDGMASCLNNIGIVHGSINGDSLQLVYYNRALKLSEDNNNKWRSSIILDNIGGVFRDKGDYETAILYFDKAFEYLSAADFPDYMFLATNLHNKAKLYILTNNLDLAEETLKKAESYILRSEKKRKLYLSQIYLTYSNLYEKKHDFQKALTYYTVHDSILKSFEDLRVSAEIERIQFEYDRRKYEQKVKAEKELEKQKYETQKIWLISLITGFCSILIFSLIIFLQKNKLSEAYKNLVTKNLEIVSSEKLKDRRNTNSIPISPKNGSLRKYSNSALNSEQKDALLNKIIDCMENEKLFTKDTISMDGLAEILDTNKNYISQVINEKLNKNFSTFVNEYRISEARKRLASEEGKYLTIEAIANSTGFNSISAFNYAFKKFTGLTPSYFLKSVKEQKNGYS